ncbi:MAG TPA: carboxypeptidase regulatory-like domain-containing protein [Terriglobia bacterium]|nr:carboxypeptidase regulatory-like domain-containing protein [Terriglobia bacterium]
MQLLRIFAILLALPFQQAVNSASVSGRIEDQTGGSIAAASVTIRSIDRNQSTTTTTDERGRFRFLYLPVGSYDLRVEKPDFAPATAKLTLSVGQTLEVPIQLSVASVVAEVHVEENLPIVELARTQVSGTIAPKEIDSLPLNGRNYLDLALLIPGVSRTNTGNNERFAETSAVPGTGISVAGQRNLGNGFVVDGLSANDDAADLAGTFFSPEVIHEFQVVASGGIAEFGRASSGVVNVVTQSGTNEWRGKLYGFLRNQRFDATNIFAAVDAASGKRIRSPLTQGQYGASAGGPLRRDRVFLFSNFEREDLNRSGFISISPANVSVINPVLDRAGYTPPRVVTGEYPTGDNRTNFFAKTDFVLASSNRLATRYSLYDIFSPNARNVGGLSTISRGTLVADRDQTFALNDVATLSANAVNEARFQFTHSRFKAPGNDLAGPAVSISGVANFGASTSSPTARDIDLFEAANNYSMQRGAHFLKTGFDLLYNRVNIVFPASLYGSYSFTSLANFQTGAYNTFAQAFGKVDWFQTNPNLGWFIQDEWRVRPDLTLNAGIRHDVSRLSAGIQTRGRNFSPRIGLAYAPGNHRTVIRVGFGQYYDRIPLRAVANALRGAGTDYKSVTLQGTQAGAPVFPNKLASFPTGTLFNLATIDPHIENAYGLQGNLQIEREVAQNTSVSVGYLYLRGIHIIMQRNLNAPTLTAAQDPINLGRSNPNFGNITQYSGQGDSYYNGMTLSFQHRASKGAMARVSYTFSKAIDNTGNFFFSSPQNNFNVRDDRGLSDNDQRHRLSVSGQVTIKKFQLSPIFNYGSAYPFNIVTGGQTIQTTAARPAGIGRNTGVGFNSASLDVRLSRQLDVTERVKMEFIAESFNTLNRTNLQFPNNTFGTGTVPLPAFGTATAASDPRQIQLGLRLSF